MRLHPILFVPVFAGLGLFVSAQEKPATDATSPLRELRKKHHTQLLTHPAAPKPPAGVFNLISYKSPAGSLAAYLSPDPGDGKKHPVIIWLTGGFSNSISEEIWGENPDPANDQTAGAYRKAGVPMMFPSLRGGNANPGEREGLFGEVEDVIAAAAHVAKLPWVDSSRIYLGGHSTGGTLALLVAGNSDVFRAVISFGPVESVASYGQEVLPFDTADQTESDLRDPVHFLPEIKSPTFILEGQGRGNVDSLRLMKKKNRNQKVQFFEIAGGDHFTVLHPFNEMLARKILADTGKDCTMALSEEDIKTAKAGIVTRGKGKSSGE
jgi:dipeptidyl aminopeptidase/acylaminoacyl peptidase